MSNFEIEEQVTKILVDKLGVAKSEVTSDANFIRDLGIDSLDYAELVMEFEQNFKIKIPDTDAGEIVTVETAVNYIGNKVNL